jgi:hypothetical protein
VRAGGARIRTLTAVGPYEVCSDDTEHSSRNCFCSRSISRRTQLAILQWAPALWARRRARSFNAPTRVASPSAPFLSPPFTPYLASSNPGWGQTGMPFLATAKLSPYDLGRVPALPAPGMVDAPLPIFCGSRTS